MLQTPRDGGSRSSILQLISTNISIDRDVVPSMENLSLGSSGSSEKYVPLHRRGDGTVKPKDDPFMESPPRTPRSTDTGHGRAGQWQPRRANGGSNGGSNSGSSRGHSSPTKSHASNTRREFGRSGLMIEHRSDDGSMVSLEQVPALDEDPQALYPPSACVFVAK